MKVVETDRLSLDALLTGGLVPLPEFLRLTGISRTTAWRMRRRGKLRTHRVGKGKISVPASELERFTKCQPTPAAQVTGEERLFKLSDVASLLRTSRDTLERYVRAGRLRTVQIAPGIERVSRKELARFVLENLS
jgi:predicted site-specific integrase-resolvase